ENRRILIEGLPEAGLTKFLPADGAFYLYADVSDFTSDSFAFARRMLEEAHVAATPGVDFDPVHGKNFIRFSYARSTDDMREAVRRIARWLTKYASKNPPGFCRAVFILAVCSRYSPPPKRRDHQPALRGCASPLVSAAGSGAFGSGVLCMTGGGASEGALPDPKLTFSRTVERRRAAFSLS